MSLIFEFANNILVGLYQSIESPKEIVAKTYFIVLGVHCHFLSEKWFMA
jgi:hypothetical protein